LAILFGDFAAYKDSYGGAVAVLVGLILVIALIGAAGVFYMNPNIKQPAAKTVGRF